MRHKEFQSRLRLRLFLPEGDTIAECVAKILADDEELRYPSAIATEFLFGCEERDLPRTGFGSTRLGILFDHLFAGENPELLQSIAFNHEWLLESEVDEVHYNIYPSEYLVITGPARDQVVQFIKANEGQIDPDLYEDFMARGGKP